MATKTRWLTDKYKSTTKIVPFVTMKSLTPEVKEYIESQGGGGTQVQANWNETDTESPAYIQNKPNIPSAPVQSNWNENDTNSLAYIQNKPTIPTVKNYYQHNIFIKLLRGSALYGNIWIKILNDSDTSFTLQTLYNWLLNNGFTPQGSNIYEDGYPCNGEYPNANPIFAIQVESNQFFLSYYLNGSIAQTGFYLTDTIDMFTDKVIPL